VGSPLPYQPHQVHQLLQPNYQQRVQQWCVQAFGLTKANDVLERQWRFIEESLELVQSLGEMTQEDCHKLVDYVFNRPPGDPNQELGGTMVTLAAMCTPLGLDMDAEGNRELDRINAKPVMDKIRAKQAAKDKAGLYTHIKSPLPGDPDTDT
jgi:hypothetical protein